MARALGQRHERTCVPGLDCDPGHPLLDTVKNQGPAASTPIPQGLLSLVFGEPYRAAETGAEEEGKKHSKIKKAARPAFPSLGGFGLIEMQAHMTTDLAKWMVERALARGITEVRLDHEPHCL